MSVHAIIFFTYLFSWSVRFLSSFLFSCSSVVFPFYHGRLEFQVIGMALTATIIFFTFVSEHCYLISFVPPICNYPRVRVVHRA
ncbi:hypothetical protein DFP73DRAFT_322479 [Morchella snyderi]|nr:hypothetical protein DFP73DRAFT_322479 [Morchella snyderi]